MVFLQQIAAEKRALARYFRTYSEFSFRRIARECGITKSSAQRICSRGFDENGPRKSEKKQTGRPRKVSKRHMRTRIRALKNLRSSNVHVTVKSLVEESGLNPELASRRTYSRYLNELGYSYLSARRKGVLSDNDKKLRLRFARKMKREMMRNPSFWTDEISFYLDAVSFVHKFNPKSGAASNQSRVWRRREEGLQLTAKGSKELAGGRRYCNDSIW